MSRQRRLRWQPVDWSEYAADPALLLCSDAAQAMWPRILAILWYAEPRGYLLIHGVQPSFDELAALWRRDVRMLPAVFAELEARGLLSHSDAGAPFCKRMVDDEARRQAAESLPPPEEQKRVLDAAVAITAADAERRAKQNKRQAQCRSRKRAAKVLDQMRAFAAMERAAATQVSRDTPPKCHVTERDSHVTNFEPKQHVTADLLESESESDSFLKEEGPLALRADYVASDDWRSLRRRRRA